MNFQQHKTYRGIIASVHLLTTTSIIEKTKQNKISILTAKSGFIGLSMLHVRLVPLVYIRVVPYLSQPFVDFLWPHSPK